MSYALSVDTLKSIDNHYYDLYQIVNLLELGSIDELFCLLKSLNKDDFEDMLEQNHFRETYHSFLYKLGELATTREYMTQLNICINNNIKAVKHLVISHGKRNKNYIMIEANRLLRDLEANQSDIENQRVTKYESGNALVFNYIVKELKNIDAVYYYISHHPEIVNITYENNPYVIYIIRLFISSVNTIPVDIIEYYKRVITAMLLSESVKIDEESFNELKKDIFYRIIKNDHCRRHYEYISYLLDKFGKYDFKEPRKNIIVAKNIINDRVDLRYLPTITVDFFKRYNGTKLLYDDAFSIEENKDDTTTLYVHVPDVDEYIKDNKELNEYIKNISQSRYAENNKLPMIPYNIAGNMSLVSGRETACITFMIKIDNKGNILSTDFLRTIVLVNSNLSINKAEDIMRKGDTFAPVLNKMFEIAKKMKKKRKSRDKRSKSGTIMDEFNIWTNIATASFFDDNKMLFPFKNHIAVDYYQTLQPEVDNYLEKQELDKNAANLLKEVVNTRSRDFYSTMNLGNCRFNNLPYCNVGNPLREYMSLETARLIKSLMILKDKTEDDWKASIENDCIEQTELQARVKELYKTTK